MNTVSRIAAAVWRWLTEPSKVIAGTERRRAQLLSSLLLVFVLVFVVAIVLAEAANLDFHLYNPPFIPAVVLVILIAAAYALSRTSHFMMGAALAVISISALAFVTALLKPTHSALDLITLVIFPIVAVMLSSLFFPLSATTLTVAANTAWLLLIPVLTPQAPLQTIVPLVAVFVLTSVFSIIAKHHHSRLEMDRLAALVDSEARFRDMYEEAPLAYFSVGVDGRIRIVNRRAADLLGYEVGDLIGRPVLDLYADTPAGREKAQEVFARFATGTEIHSEELEMRRADGEQVWINLTARPIRNNKGQIIASRSMAVDITDRKQVEEELRASEEKYRDLVENLDEAIYAFDASGVMVYISPTIESLIGYSPSEIIGRSFAEFVHPEDLERVRENVGRLLSGQSLGMNEYRVVTKSGGTRWISTSSQPIIEQGGVEGLRGVLVDITQRKQAEEALQHHADQLALLNEITRIGTATLDMNELLQTLADTAAGIIGGNGCYITLWDEENRRAIPKAAYGPLRERYFREPVSRPGDRTLTESVLKAGHPLVVEDVFNTPYLSRHIAERYPTRSMLALPLQAGERGLGALLIAFNQRHRFTEDEIEWGVQAAELIALALSRAQAYAELEKRVEARTAELEAAHKRLLTLTRLRDEFVANISHELRTPITNLRLYIHLLKLAPDKREQYLATLNRETNRLERIVEDMLALSDLDRERVELKLAPVDLHELVGMYVSDHTALAEKQELTLTFAGEPGLPDVQADPALIERVLSILLANALSYTPRGGRVTVTTRTCRIDDHRWVCFDVSDTGPGIPPEERPRLFERFFRGKIALGTGTPGTGLGLAIAKEIVDRHGGRIEVDGEGVPGQGVTFTVWLPVEE